MKSIPRWSLVLPFVLFTLPSYANTPAGRYTLGSGSSSGSLTDTKTGLVWQQADDGTTYTWANAKLHCASLPLDGGGWRFPTVKELATTVDYTIQNPSIDTTVFTGTTALGYWSSTPLAGSSSGAWYVDFHHGRANYIDVSNMYRVRCVR